MSTESSSKNIHVFRVNRLAKNKDESSEQKTSSEPVVLANTRTCLSAETKRRICEDHINNPKFTQEALALKYGCKRTTVAKIIKSKERWLSIDSNAAVAKRYRQRNSRYPLVENALILWLQNEQQDDLENVTDQMLRCQARQYAQTFSVEGLEDFKASSSWVSNFKQRYLIPKLHMQKDSNNVPSTSISVATPISSSSSISSNEDDNLTPTSPVSGFQKPTSALSASSPPSLISFRSLLPPISSVTHAPTSQKQAVERNSCLKRTTKDAITGSSRTNEFIIREWSLHSKELQTTVTQPSRQVSMGFNHAREQKAGDKRSEQTSSSVSQSNNRHRSDSNTSDTSNSSSDNSHVSETIPDMMDYTDDFDTETHCFDNNDSYFSPRKQLGSVSQKLQEKRQKIVLPVEDSKLMAKKHLEAALDFYASQHGGNSSMSANMIKLILQNDF